MVFPRASCVTITDVTFPALRPFPDLFQSAEPISCMSRYLRNRYLHVVPSALYGSISVLTIMSSYQQIYPVPNFLPCLHRRSSKLIRKLDIL